MRDLKLGLGLVNVLAMIISYDQHRSSLWALLHGFAGVFYLLYYWLF